MDRGPWLAAVHGVTKSQTQLNNEHTDTHTHTHTLTHTHSGSPVVKTPCFHCRGFDPWSETKTLHVAWHDQEKGMMTPYILIGWPWNASHIDALNDTNEYYLLDTEFRAQL